MKELCPQPLQSPKQRKRHEDLTNASFPVRLCSVTFVKCVLLGVLCPHIFLYNTSLDYKVDPSSTLNPKSTIAFTVKIHHSHSHLQSLKQIDCVRFTAATVILMKEFAIQPFENESWLRVVRF
jgi:hypothetical protein